MAKFRHQQVLNVQEVIRHKITAHKLIPLYDVLAFEDQEVVVSLVQGLVGEPSEFLARSSKLIKLRSE